MPNTTSWINILLSIEKVFRDYVALTDCNIFHCALPGTVAEQRAYCNSDDPHALFLQIVQGDPNRIQDTYVTCTLCEDHTQQNYLPQENLRGVWLQTKVAILQQFLNRGEASFANLFPLYDFQNLLPVSTYETFLTDGNIANVRALLTGTPVIIQQTGFVVRAGHARPRFIFTENPMKCEWTTVWQHWSYDVWCSQRG